MMLWYPLVRRRELMLLLENLPRLPGLTDWLDVRLQVSAPPEDGFGLSGSGVFVINPPSPLAPSLKEAMPGSGILACRQGGGKCYGGAKMPWWRYVPDAGRCESDRCGKRCFSGVSVASFGLDVKRPTRYDRQPAFVETQITGLWIDVLEQ